MKNELPHWSKTELKIYILLLCAKADSQESIEEIDLIKSKIDNVKFNSIYAEFCKDDEESSLEKINYNIHQHEFSHKEIHHLKEEIIEVFSSDNKYTQVERNLERFLASILY